MGVESAVLLGASAGLNALGGVFDAIGQGRDLDNQAALAERNAVIVQRNAHRQEEAHRREARQAQGRLRAQLAAAGAGGRPDIVRQSLIAAEMDAQAIRRSADNQSESLRLQAGQYRAGANRARTLGVFTGLAGGLSAANAGGLFTGSQPDGVKTTSAGPTSLFPSAPRKGAKRKGSTSGYSLFSGGGFY